MSLEQLKKDAKRFLKALRENNPTARARYDAAYPGGPAEPGLRDIQHAIARHMGYESWIALTLAFEDKPEPNYEQAAADWIAAFNAKDEPALARLNQHYDRVFTFEDLWAEVWRRVYAFRQRAFGGTPQQLELAEAQMLVAQDAGFNSWDALMAAKATRAPAVPAFAIDARDDRIAPRRYLTTREWDTLIDAVRERRITSLDAGGFMTDEVLARIAALDHVTSLSLGGSRALTDTGLQALARMPQLEHLDLSEYPGGKLTDRGLEVLRHLPNLRSFSMTWQKGITDAGVANLRHCDQLERVNLMGSPTGDGAIEALQGKPHLSHFSTGRLVTDRGLPLLHNFPMLTNLLIDGPFTNAGLASLAGLEGVADLDLFWHVTGITTDAFAGLRHLPNLAALGADGKLSDDTAMAHFAAIPKLQRLRAQETIATDRGFEALARSRTLEGLWTRRHAGVLTDRAYVALSTMPSLKQLGVSWKDAGDAALAKLPEFPSLRELTPIDVKDNGFRHVGRCERLERLTCMYCREIGDAATEHIAALSIRYYYAGLTQITDRSLEILGRIQSLEQIEMYECLKITDAGLPFLSALPRLKEVAIHGSPGVTLAGTRVFADTVRVQYGT